MLEDYREFETRRDGNGNFVLSVRGVVSGRKRSSTKSYSRGDDAGPVMASLEAEITGRPVSEIIDDYTQPPRAAPTG